MLKRSPKIVLGAIAASALLTAGLSLGTPATAFAAEGVCTMATTAALNLRADASMQGKVVAVMPQGTSVEVYGMSRDGWYHVNYNGTEGYCYYRWLNFEGTAEGTVHDGKQTEMFAICPLNVRSEVGMHGKVIGVLNTDEAVAVTHKENHWFRVEYKGQTGYCYGEYLSFTKGGYEDPNDTAGKNVMNDESSDPGDTAGKNVMNDEVAGGTSSTMNKLTTTAPLNVRAEPRNSGRRIGVLAKGTQVSPLDQSADGWVLIDYNGTQGWVYSGYLN